jgi:hypothetical protein
MRKNHAKCSVQNVLHIETYDKDEDNKELITENEQLQEHIMSLRAQLFQEMDSKTESILESLESQHNTLLSELERLLKAVEHVALKEADTKLQIDQTLTAHQEQMVSIKEDLKKILEAISSLQKSANASAAPSYTKPKKTAIEKKFTPKK